MTADALPQDYEIRLAAAEDIHALAAVEITAAAQFRDAGIEGDFLDQSTDPELLAAAQAQGRLWVACGGGEVVGFALARLLSDGNPHLEEIDVHPAHGRRGLGRALVDAVAAWARAGGHQSLSLSTFRKVAWNAPWYARLGFVPVGALTPALAVLVDRERRSGLPVADRVVMCLDLAPPRG